MAKKTKLPIKFTIWCDDSTGTSYNDSEVGHSKYLVSSAVELMSILLDFMHLGDIVSIDISGKLTKGKSGREDYQELEWMYPLAHSFRNDSTIWIDRTRLGDPEYLEELAELMWRQALKKAW